MKTWFKGSRSAGSVMAILAGLLAGEAAAAPAQTNVNCNGPGGAALQEAIDAATADQIIRVVSTCVGNFVIATDDLILQANQNGALVAADPDRPALTIRAHRVVVEGFSSISGGSNGLGLYQGASATIRKNTIEDAVRNGIVVNQNSHADIIDNVIRNNDRHGIAVVESATADAFDNDITGNGFDGVFLSRTASAVLNGNTIENNAIGGVGVLFTSTASLSATNGEIAVPNIIQNNPSYDVGCSGFSTIFAPTVVISSTGKSDIQSSCMAFINYVPPPAP